MSLQIIDDPNAVSYHTELEAKMPLTVATVEFQTGEVVWAKIRGYPHWPAKIKSFPSSKMALVVWFNDYRITKMYRTQLHKFLNNFDNFSKKFDQTIGLKTAAQEALIYYGQNIGKV